MTILSREQIDARIDLWATDGDVLSALVDIDDLIDTARAYHDLHDAVLATLFITDGGVEYEHEDGCEGEPTCPACWVADLRAIVARVERGES